MVETKLIMALKRSGNLDEDEAISNGAEKLACFYSGFSGMPFLLAVSLFSSGFVQYLAYDAQWTSNCMLILTYTARAVISSLLLQEQLLSGTTRVKIQSCLDLHSNFYHSLCTMRIRSNRAIDCFEDMTNKSCLAFVCILPMGVHSFHTKFQLQGVC